jgi:hypothetical protein
MAILQAEPSPIRCFYKEPACVAVRPLLIASAAAPHSVFLHPSYDYELRTHANCKRSRAASSVLPTDHCVVHAIACFVPSAAAPPKNSHSIAMMLPLGSKRSYGSSLAPNHRLRAAHRQIQVFQAQSRPPWLQLRQVGVILELPCRSKRSRAKAGVPPYLGQRQVRRRRRLQAQPRPFCCTYLVFVSTTCTDLGIVRQ